MTERRSDIPPSLRDLLSGFGARIGMQDTRAIGAIWSRWTEIAGDSIAANAEPTSLRNGILRIRATSPGWATELTYLATEIVQRANNVAGRGVVREVRIWTGPGEVRQTTATASPTGLDGPATDGREPAPKDLATAFERARAAGTKKTPKRGR